MALLEVRSRTVGVPGGPAVPAVWLEVAAAETGAGGGGGDGDALTLREIVRRAVRAQFTAAGSAGGVQAESEARRSVGAQFRADRERAEPVGDAAAEEERALAAVGGGLVAVFMGGRRLECLDEQVPVREGDRITFLRLTALAGG
ncbi:hypothetical protein SAMN05216223_102398 [Actinacidiphila yanglinensis]|uniref:MoaD/ThiS family protein n=2 Tax=Actinacidiphila yanglinensis TaxID=310779 RepID=A0A1H5VQN1_9ACTN|nr:hypothetical protein SAMN05216223_102398 [Actinacidiphila yanglinensis]